MTTTIQNQLSFQIGTYSLDIIHGGIKKSFSIEHKNPDLCVTTYICRRAEKKVYNPYGDFETLLNANLNKDILADIFDGVPYGNEGRTIKPIRVEGVVQLERIGETVKTPIVKKSAPLNPDAYLYDVYSTLVEFGCNLTTQILSKKRVKNLEVGKTYNIAALWKGGYYQIFFKDELVIQ